MTGKYRSKSKKSFTKEIIRLAFVADGNLAYQIAVIPGFSNCIIKPNTLKAEKTPLIIWPFYAANATMKFTAVNEL